MSIKSIKTLLLSLGLMAAIIVSTQAQESPVKLKGETVLASLDGNLVKTLIVQKTDPNAEFEANPDYVKVTDEKTIKALAKFEKEGGCVSGGQCGSWYYDRTKKVYCRTCAYDTPTIMTCTECQSCLGCSPE